MELYKVKILLSGATGFIGQHLLKSLLKNGDHQIHAIVREESKHLDSSIQQYTLNSIDQIDGDIDIFINLAGENIASKPWTNKRKSSLYKSRVTLTNHIHKSLKHPPATVISMSAVGFYGIAKHGVFYENTPPKTGFAHELCSAWEESANAFSEDSSRVVIYRLGVVLGKGGALSKMRLPFLLGFGGPIAGGKQWFSWIHIDDVINAILNAISDPSYNGTYNLVAPQLIEQKRFAQSYAASLKRPAILPTPKWALDMIFGEMATLLTEGPKIVPQKLEKQGFEFKFKDIDDALLEIESRH